MSNAPEIDIVELYFQGVGKIIGHVYSRVKLKDKAEKVKIVLKKKRVLLPGTKIAETTVPYSAENGAEFTLKDIPVPLPEGDYYYDITLYDTDKKEVKSAEKDFKFKRYSWLGNRIGKENRVLKPWAPIKVDKNEIQVIGRKYLLSDTGLIKQIINQQENMFNAPMTLKGGAGKQSLALLESKYELVDKSDTECKWTGKNLYEIGSQKLKVNVNGRLDYDGHIEYNLTIAPENDPVKIDKLYLDVPIKADLAKMYLMVFQIGRPGGYGCIPPYGYLPDSQGEIFSSKKWYDYTGPELIPLSTTGVFDHRKAAEIDKSKIKLQKRWKPTLGSFIPQMWIGDDKEGFSYMADNDFGWFPSDKFPAVNIVRKGNTVYWRFNFISEPSVIKETRHLRLSFQATPEKPQPKNWRKHFPKGWALEKGKGVVALHWLSDDKGWDREGVGTNPYNPELSQKTTDKLHEEGFMVIQVR
jgi:hypothetical protein